MYLPTRIAEATAELNGQRIIDESTAAVTARGMKIDEEGINHVTTARGCERLVGWGHRQDVVVLEHIELA